MEYKFLKQSKSGSDKNLCGFFSLYHFKNGDITREEYKNKASQLYIDNLGMSAEDAKELVENGNDPAVFLNFGLKCGDLKKIKEIDVLIICDTNKGHFFTIRKIDGLWWNFDSYNFDEKQRIGSDENARSLCSNFQIYHS